MIYNNENKPLSKGQAFEEAVFNRLFDFYWRNDAIRSNIIRRADKATDTFQGTDIFIGKVRIDITINTNKSRLSQTFKFGQGGTRVALRYGNRADLDFAEPVMVLVFDTKTMTINEAAKQAANEIIDSINKIEKIYKYLLDNCIEQ